MESPMKTTRFSLGAGGGSWLSASRNLASQPKSVRSCSSCLIQYSSFGGATGVEAVGAVCADGADGADGDWAWMAGMEARQVSARTAPNGIRVSTVVGFTVGSPGSLTVFRMEPRAANRWARHR